MNPEIMEINIKNKDLSGYNVDLAEPLQEKFICSLCKNLMRNPIQTTRGELACESCYFSSKRSDGKCPIDGEPATKIFKDNGIAREILNLRCCCENEKYGCIWKGTVREVENHQSSCDFHPTQCFYCKEYIVPKELSDHLKTCQTLLEQNDCIYKNVGCNYKPADKEDAKKHLEEDMFLHATLYAASLQNLQSQNAVLQKELNLQLEHSEETESKYQTQIELLMEQISTITNSFQALQTEFEKTQKKLQVEVQEIRDTATRKHNGSLNALNSHSVVKDIEDNKKEIQTLTTSNTLMNTNVSDLDLKQQLLENTTYNGRMLWKIDNYTHRLQQAITGKVTALHSAPAFTDRYGYKFCARLYLNGDGMGKNTHMSLFFVLMKSEYDNLLEWPFRRRVTFRLINQDDQTESVKETFIPDKNSSSFQKPTRQMNIAAGCPLFIPKEELSRGGFIKDDCLFIETVVT